MGGDGEGTGLGNLTLSPQVSRFSQTRLRLWGAWEDRTRRRGEQRRKKKDVDCAQQRWLQRNSSDRQKKKRICDVWCKKKSDTHVKPPQKNDLTGWNTTRPKINSETCSDRDPENKSSKKKQPVAQSRTDSAAEQLEWLCPTRTGGEQRLQSTGETQVGRDRGRGLKV